MAGKHKHDGPFCLSLESSLQKLNVERQAYRGNGFIGNHVHKLLQVDTPNRIDKKSPITISNIFSHLPV